MILKNTLLLTLTIFIGLGTAMAQDDSIIDDVGTALRTGSSKELSKFFNDVIELKIDGEKENYSRTQAEVIVRNFFTKYPPKNFTKIHNGSSPDGLQYVLGKYAHNEGTHRVYMLIKKTDGSFKIDTLDLTKE
ncbi:MAG: DUF4783 domain-containing protein [bacterium]|nr:DUF4783 domain-containing protein [bacterium]